MAFVVSLTGVRPAPRYDAIPWTDAAVEESATALPGTWTERQAYDLALNGTGIDADPTSPQRRDLTVNAAASDQSYFRVRFEDGAANVSYTEPIGISGYPTTEALVEASTNPALLAKTADQQDALRRIAITNVERFCGQSFTPRDKTVRLDGSGGVELWLPERLEALSAISLKGTTIDLTDVSIADDGARIYFAPLSTGYAVQAMREHGALDTRTFRSGPGVVTLTGRWGWTVVPDAVKEALRLEMEAEASGQASALAPIVASARRLGLKTIAQGNLRADVGDPSFITPESGRLLGGYVWTGGAGFIV